MQLMRTVIALLGVLAASSPLLAAQEKELQVSGTAGWNGKVVHGDWTPVRIDLDNRGSKDTDLVIAVTWGGSYGTQSSPNPTLEGTNFYGRTGPTLQIPVTLPAKSRKRLSLSILTPDAPQISVWAFALDPTSGRTLARGELMTRFLDAQKRLVAVVGRVRPEGLEDDHVEGATLPADELPEDWQGYSSLEALVWLDGKATELRSAAQVDALKQWISTGGKFYVARGNALDFGGTPVADLLPVKLGSTLEVADLGRNHFPKGPTVILDSTLRGGIVRAAADGHSLVVEGSRDAGRVTFVSFDPTRDSFASTPQAKTFWKWLLRIEPHVEVREDFEVLQAPSAIGSYGLAEQAGRFPDISAPEIGGLFILILLYLVVVGPLDYFLLRKLKKLEYTWFTFPTYVAVFTLSILFVGGAFIQREGHQRELVVVDHYPDTSFQRRHALSAVLAPSDLHYRAADAQPLSSNFIQQYRTFDTGGSLTDIRIQQTPARVAENWLINRNFTGLAMADRCSSAPAPVSYTITSQDSVGIQLKVKNRSDQTLEGSALATPQGVYWVSSIPPGEASMSGSRISSSLLEYVQREGLRQPPRYGNGDDSSGDAAYAGYAGGMNELQLIPVARRALISACFPLTAVGQARPQTGFARSLEADSWIKSGGSVLLAWPRETVPTVRFEPTPARYSSVCLYRFFQGPPP